PGFPPRDQHRLVRCGHAVSKHRFSFGNLGSGLPRYAPSSGSLHCITSTVRPPREPQTTTLAPLGSGCSDHARYASVPPFTLTSTSPGPSGPRVATVNSPKHPTADWSGGIGGCSSRACSPGGEL